MDFGEWLKTASDMVAFLLLVMGYGLWRVMLPRQRAEITDRAIQSAQQQLEMADRQGTIDRDRIQVLTNKVALLEERVARRDNMRLEEQAALVAYRRHVAAQDALLSSHGLTPIPKDRLLSRLEERL